MTPALHGNYHKPFLKNLADRRCNILLSSIKNFTKDFITVKMAEFKDLKDVLRKLADEDVARKYLEQIRWNGNPICPHCGAGKPYKLKDGKRYRCSSAKCRKNYSVTVGTIFENSKIALSTWVGALYLCTNHKKGVSSCQIARDLSITQKSAWFVLHRLRYLMGDKMPKILDNVVEVDEVYHGGKWGNRSKYKRKLQYEGNMPDDKTPIMGIVQRLGDAKLEVIGNNDTFKDMVQRHVKPTAIVVTDAHLAYRGLDETHAGHIIVNHSENQYATGIYSTNTVEGFFTWLRRSVYGVYHQISVPHLQQYCSEVAYRYNTRKLKDGDRFTHALTRMEGRLKYKQLIKKP